MRKAWIGYTGKDADKIWVTLEGNYTVRQPSECDPNCTARFVPFREDVETSSGNVQVNINDDDGARIDPGKLWSTHKFRVHGQTLEYTGNGGKLYLY